MAGDIVMPRAKEKGVNIIPVDSEHCAIHQCIKDISQVDKLIITASGGPFLHKTIDDMKNATVAQALNHPRWSMGKKITVDSATLMNKGLEIIEAHHLFNMPYEKIDVVVHPQSIVHSAIEYVDGSVIAQLGLPSMHIPIQYAITYPERFEGIKSKSFSFADIARLDFEKPDFEKFPSVKMAYEAGKIGGSATVCMNAANEEAVFAFLEDKIKLYEIYQITSKTKGAVFSLTRSASTLSRAKKYLYEDLEQITFDGIKYRKRYFFLCRGIKNLSQGVINFLRYYLQCKIFFLANKFSCFYSNFVIYFKDFIN